MRNIIKSNAVVNY